MIYKTTGDVLINYGRAEMVPYLLMDNDVAMGCATGEALTPLLLSFESVGSNPDRLAPLVFTVAATCTEALALEEELRYSRALKEGRVSEAQDARELQKRYLRVTAQRYHKAYQRTTAQYGEADNGQCPRLRTDFDELVWLVGQIAGVQAVLNDGASDASLGIPRDIAAKVERGAACVDNEKWWGVPNGTRAALWSILPMFAPEGADPWREMDRSVRIGFEQGVRLPSALFAIAAHSVGDEQRVRRAIREFSKNDSHIDQNYAMLDALAEFLITGISDRLWTEATGKRTPFGGLGTFWDDQRSSQPAFDIDDLL
ncbi:MAG: hypothetical protein C0462_02510 [Alcanivorax sp.]|nr:hypothetical protein [Alcanivorax sp.]